MHLSEQDLYLFNEGSHFRLADRLGAHIETKDGKAGVTFSVWAPNARHVSVVGDFNGWNGEANHLQPQGQSGIWAGFVPGVKKGQCYKYFIQSHHNGYKVQKADPMAICTEVAPKTGSVVWDLDYKWNDAAWMKERRNRQSHSSPISIYEVHLGSWMRVPAEGNRSLNYRELAVKLADHVSNMGFTHVELMPILEHPFFGSWGYQVTGYFAPTSRFGTPQDFMHFVDALHQRGIGVLLDWVPSHFPTDEHGLGFFDGTHLYEHADDKEGFHPDWKSFIFNYGRNEVQSFLISSALFWMEKYHLDGLRVDGVASMLYRDYSRKAGEWVPNEHGGRENLEAIAFLRRMNEEIYKSFPDSQTIAEESTAWPMVSKPTFIGGLGFGFKWDMGWMHDILDYMARDPIHRTYHQSQLTFRLLYAFTENFVLSLSHDEVVHGKGSLLGKMPGDAWQKFANLRALYGMMFGMSGKKLLFMGSEFGQGPEWNHDGSVSWEQSNDPQHQGILTLVRDLNAAYRREPALHLLDCDVSGFEWVDCSDAAGSIVSFLRHGAAEKVLVVCNFTPVPRSGYRLGVPVGGRWTEIINTDAPAYGGGGVGNFGGLDADDIPSHGRPHSLNLNIPPLGAVFFKAEEPA